MTFRARLALRISLLVGLAALVGIVALAGVSSLRDRLAQAEHQYRQLREVYEIGHRAALAREMFRSDASPADSDLERLRALPIHASIAPSSPDPRVAQLRERFEASLMDASTANGGSGAFERVLGDVASLAGQIQEEIVSDRSRAARRAGFVIVGIAGLVALAIGAGIWIGLAQYRSVMRPLGRLRTGVEAIARGDLATRLEHEGDAEFRVLIEQFNSMGERLHHLTTAMEGEVERAGQNLIRAERLASVGVLAAGVAHEINNPLAIIAGYAQTSLRRLDRANGEAGEMSRELRETLSIIHEEVFRSRAITDQLLDLARPSQSESASVDLASLTRRALALVEAHPARPGRTLAFDAPESDCLVKGVESELLQVILNLVVNALEATTPDGGVVRIRCAGHGDRGVLEIADNGRGLTDLERSRAFEPFWSSKGEAAPPGRGLGLAVSHAIVERHGGQLSVESAGRGRGAHWRLELPLATSPISPIST